MVTNNAGVIMAWKNGESARSNNGNLWTNGHELKSYDLVIGITSNLGIKVLMDYRGKQRASMTTSRHVGMAYGVLWPHGLSRNRQYVKVADHVLTPDRAHWHGNNFPEWAYGLGEMVNNPRPIAE